MTTTDPGDWAAIAQGYEAAGYTFVNGQWVPPSNSNSTSSSGGAANGVIDASDLSGAPANTQADPNAGSDSLSQQTAYAMQQYNSNPAVQQYFASNYPDLAWMTSNPELLQILVSASINGWDQGKIDAALSQTQWWSQNGQAARQFIQLQATDPTTAAQEIASNKALVMTQAQNWGVALNDQQLTQLATNATMFNWNADQIAQNVRSAYTIPTGQVNTNAGITAQMQQTIQNVAGQYLVNASPDMIKFWTNAAMQNGAADPATANSELQASLQNYLAQQASQRFPFMKDAIAQGMTPQQYLDPYTQQAAKTLSTSTDAIDWTDPKYQAALLGNDSMGNPLPLNVDQFNKNLMSNPIFGYSKTAGAIQQAYATANTIEQTFGKVKT